MQPTIRLYSLSHTDTRTYLATLIFITGNLLVPQLFHLLPQGGATWLPIYLFTLIGAYKYGWCVGLLTAVCSPVLNHLLFDMPMLAVLPSILLKSLLLALTAANFAYRFQQVTLTLLIAIVLIYQCIGTLGEWILCGNIYQAVQDFRLGIPGMLLQIFGGYAVIRYLMRR